MTRPLSLALGCLVLLALTVGLSRFESSVPDGVDRVPDPIQGGWRLRGDRGGTSELVDGVVHLSSRKGQRAVAFYDLVLPDDRFRWRVTAHLKAPKPAQVKVVLAAADGDRRIWVGSYRVESDEWTDIAMPVTADLRGMDVSVGVLLRGEAGDAELDRIDLEPVVGRPWWTASIVGLGLGWLVFGGLVLRQAGAAVVGVVSVLVVGVTFPRTWLDVFLGRFAGVRIGGESVVLVGQKLAGHAGLFAVIGGLLAIRFGAMRSMALVLALGIITETLQLVSVARSASALDVALDVAGGVVGVSVVWVWARLFGASPKRPV